VIQFNSRQTKPHPPPLSAPPPSERIKEMRDAVEQLEKREKYLEKKSDTELISIKKLQGKNRKGSLLLEFETLLVLNVLLLVNSCPWYVKEKEANRFSNRKAPHGAQ